MFIKTVVPRYKKDEKNDLECKLIKAYNGSYYDKHKGMNVSIFQKCMYCNNLIDIIEEQPIFLTKYQQSLLDSVPNINYSHTYDKSEPCLKKHNEYMEIPKTLEEGE